MSNYRDFIDTPLEGLDYSFLNYLTKKKDFERKHLDGNGLPNYAFKTDYELRKKLDSMPGVYKFAKTYCATVVPQAIQQYSMQGVTVGPNQFPEIYEMVRDCANTLGIGIPTLIIVPSFSTGDSVTDFNACTMATDDIEPVILVTGLIIERFTADELKSVIAHECGHIHNNHTLYRLISDVLLNFGINGLINFAANTGVSIPGLQLLLNGLTAGAQLALQMWSRAAEVSADRASVICMGGVDAVKSSLGKFMYNGADLSNSTSAEINLDALKEQMEIILNSPYRIAELDASHPMSIKRVFAALDFAECERFYSWRPDLKAPGKKLYTKDETDNRCKRYINVLDTKGAKK